MKQVVCANIFKKKKIICVNTHLFEFEKSSSPANIEIIIDHAYKLYIIIVYF